MSVRRFLKGLDRGLVKKHSWILLPLAATQLLQRMEHVVDNRFISELGVTPLLIHSINFNFFLVAQAVGLAASTSALIFWKREECAHKQKSILDKHVRAAAFASLAIGIFCAPFIPTIIRQYGVPAAFMHPASVYLGVGLINMVLAAIYTPLNALLIASDQRVKSLVNVAVLILIKIGAGTLALHLAIGAANMTLPMLTIAVGGSIAITALSITAWRHVSERAQGERPFAFADMHTVWGNEMGTAIIRSVSPFLYTYFLAKSLGGPSLLITYQLTLHLAYILVLPQLAGTQLAIRDASAEQSLPKESRTQGLLNTEWFRWFFAVSILPTQILLGLGALFAPILMKVLYRYSLPPEHVTFVAIYLGACAVGQIGNIYLVVLRALRRNAAATRNIFTAEICVMVVLTGIAVELGHGTPVVLGLIVVAYCTSYLGLNYATVRISAQEAA